MRGTRKIVIPMVVLLAASGAAVGWQNLPDRDDPNAAATAATPGAETVEVVIGDLTTDYDFTGDVSFGEAWTLPIEAGGVVTSNRPVGAVVPFGEELVRIDNEPVFLAEGGIPMYRELGLESTQLEGYDVAQLQQFLLRAGFDDDGDLEVSGEFDWTTRDALRDWQDAVGLDDTGTVGPSHLVFSPTPLRIEATPRVGSTFDQLQVTEAHPIVTAVPDSSERAGLPVGGNVTVELANGTTIEGTVESLEPVVADDGTTSWLATIDVAGDLGDDASVLVHSSVVEAAGVLIVPTSALLAVADGGFAVEVVDDTGSRLVPVEVGTIVDARAQITGAVNAGDRVAVPA